MKLLVSSWNRGVVGGTETYLQALLPALLDRGHEVGLLTFHEAPDGRESVDPPTASIRRFRVLEGEGAATLRQLQDWKPDAAYLHGLNDPDLEAGIVASIPSVLFAHGYYGTCGTGRKSYAWPTPRPCTRTFGPACLLLHYPRRCGGLNPLTALASYRRQSRRNGLLPRYRAVAVASRAMGAELGRHGVAADRLVHLPLPLADVLHAGAEAVHGAARDDRSAPDHLLFVGRLTDLKGVHLLLDALPLAEATLGRALRLSIAGDGPAEGRLRERAERVGVAADFLGWVSRERRDALFAEADVLAVPSVWPEPFGLSGPEAGLFGLPAVGFDVGGIADWLIPGHGGELAPGDPPTAAGLAAAIVRALGDLDHYQTLRRGARETARTLRMEVHLPRLESLLAAVAQGLPPTVSDD